MKTEKYRLNSLLRLSMLLLASVSTVSSALADSRAFLIEPYLGRFDELASKGYTDESGISLNVSRAPNALAMAVCRPFGKTKSFDCVLVITEILGHDAKGKAKLALPSEMIRIQLPTGWHYFDTADTECKSSSFPGAEIIAIGKWVERKKPLHGGYARSLRKAWRIDYQRLRFVEISARDVSCGFDDDRD